MLSAKNTLVSIDARSHMFDYIFGDHLWGTRKYEKIHLRNFQRVQEAHAEFKKPVLNFIITREQQYELVMLLSNNSWFCFWPQEYHGSKTNNTQIVRNYSFESTAIGANERIKPQAEMEDKS